MHSPNGSPPCHRWQLLDWLHKPWLDRWLVAACAHFVDSRCPFHRSFGCVLLSNPIYLFYNVPFDNTTPIYLINLPRKLGLGLRCSILAFFTENKEKRAHFLRRISLSEWVSSFLMAHQHILGYSVPFIISILSDYGTQLGSGSGLSDEQILSAMAQQNTGEFAQWRIKKEFGYSHRAIVPQHVVTDFSYALINAVLFTSNRMITSEYLQHAYNVINGNVAETDALLQCYLSICVSHMIKAMANKLRHREMEDAKKKSALTIFADL